jgi:hypothetical protein
LVEELLEDELFVDELLDGELLEDELLLVDELLLLLVDELLLKLLFEDWLEVLCEKPLLSEDLLDESSGSGLLLENSELAELMSEPEDHPPDGSDHPLEIL